MRLLSLFRRQRAVSGDGNVTAQTKPQERKPMLSTTTKKVTVRVPEPLLRSMSEICRSKGLSLNEATNLLYSWTVNQTLEFEVIKRVRKRT